MDVVVLRGSHNAHGSSAILADEFTRGAQEAGHTVTNINTAHAKVHPCTGCVRCGYEGPCVFRDDMDEIRRAILSSDMMVFATPLYYYTVTAQLKTVIDRFCSFNSTIQGKHMKSAMLAVAWNADDWTFESLETYYRTLVRYLNLEDRGSVLGYGCGTPSMTRRSQYPRMAYELGRSLV